MTQYNSNQISITLQNVLKSYQMLGSNDYEQKQRANLFLYNLVQANEAWEIANKMIREVENQQFKYLGAQILYQKIQRELSNWLRAPQNGQQAEKTYTILKSLKQFTYNQINSSFNKASIDKLSSCLALVIITSLIKGKQQGTTNVHIKNCQLVAEWKDILQQVIQFMKINEVNIEKGVKILERVTEELRTCNRLSFRHKTICKQEFFSQLEKLLAFWQSVFQFAAGYDANNKNSQVNPSSLLLNIINGLESWVKSGYPLLKYPYLINILIKTSIISFQHLQGGSRVICEVLKVTAQNKFQVLSEIHPSKEKQSYTTDEMLSLKIIVDFVIEHRNNFLSPSMVKNQIRNFNNPMEKTVVLLGTQISSGSTSKLQSEYSQIYVKIIDELLRNYSFLLFDDIGFQILSLILRATSATDLKLSSQTFEFWIFLCQKMVKSKESSKDHEQSPYLNLVPRIQQYITQVYFILLQKNMLDTDILLGEAQIKEEDTVDDSGNISFSQYRKLSCDLFKAIYDFYVSSGVLPQNNPNGHRAGLFFNSIYNLLNNSLGLEGRGVQLALFVIKSANQSMIDQTSTEYILKAIQIILQIMNTHQKNLPVKVIAESMNLIRDCTRQIKSTDKSKNNSGKILFVECLKFVLKYIDNQKLCNYAAYCFQILMESVSTVENEQLVKGLLDHYRYQKQNKKKQEHARAFSLTPIEMVQKDIIIEKVIEGVFNCIVKFQNKDKIPFYLDQFMKIIIDYYNFKENLYVELQKITVIQSQDGQLNKKNKTAIFYDCLLEIKTLLGSYQALSMDEQFKKISNGRFRQLCFHSLSIISKIFQSTLNVSDYQNIPKYSIMNELGQSVSTYKSILKICTNTNPKKIKLDDGGISDQQIQTAYAFIMSQIMHVANAPMIRELCMMLPVISETLFQFTPQGQNQKTSSNKDISIEEFKRSPIINDWIRKNIPSLNKFYIQYFVHFSQNLEKYHSSPKQNKMDPDIVKYYFLILESLILYDRGIYAEIVFKDGHSGNMSQQNAQITNFVEFTLRYVNQKQLIRRVVAFISLYISQLICSKDQAFLKYLITSQTAFQQIQKQKQKMLILLVATIPQVAIPSHTIVGKSLYLLTEHFSYQQKYVHFQVLLLRLIGNSDRHGINYSDLVPSNLSTIQKKNLELLTRMFIMAIQMRTDRFIKLAFVLLTDVLRDFNGFSSDGGQFIRNESLMQIQMNTVNWKRQMKNMKAN